MRYRVRPDLHHVPLPDGVYVSSGGRELVVTGWAGFGPLLTSCLPALATGTGEDELVETLGNPAARGAVRALLRQLNDRGMLLHLRGDAPEQPSPADRERYAELLAFLECHTDDPYAIFERVRHVAVGLQGNATAAAGALRGFGLDTTPAATGGPVIVVMDREGVDRPLPGAELVVPVVQGAGGAITGPVLRTDADAYTWRALVTRTLDRERGETPRRSVESAAVSLAAHLLVRTLADVPGAAAYAVGGPRVEVRALDLPLPSATPAVELALEDAADTAGTDDAVGWLPRLCDPWLGPYASYDEDALPQMPVALRRLRTVGEETTVRLVAATGADQRLATAAVVLELQRLQGRAAGTSPRRWLLDGALRLFAQRADHGTEDTAELVEEATPETGRLMRALRCRAEPRFALHAVPGISWRLATVHLADGRASSAWGPDADKALRHAAAAALGELLTGVEPTGCSTQALLEAGEEDAAALATEVAAWASSRGLRVVGAPAPEDPLLGPGPTFAGHVRLMPTGSVGRVVAAAEAAALPGAVAVPVSGWDPAALCSALAAATAERPVLPIRTPVDRVDIGPLWAPGDTTGCVGCAELRRRVALDHVLADDLQSDLSGTATPGRLSPPLAEVAVAMLSEAVLEPGTLLTVTTDGASWHRIARHPQCHWCGGSFPEQSGIGVPLVPPPPPALRDGPVGHSDPTRLRQGSALLTDEGLADVEDDSYGPVRGILREANVPFAMSMALLSGSPVLGHGRALSFASTRSVAVLEAYERLAGFPHEAPLVTDTAYDEVCEVAVDPLRLGRYTSEQLLHPTSKVTPYHPRLPIDWVWGLDLATGAQRLVPAEIGFYQYDYTFKRDLRAAQRSESHERRRCFLESSSGCALGSSVTEAAVHALFEVAERDAFQLAWHQAVPLPEIPHQEFHDQVIVELIDLVESHGYDLHFLRASADIDLPVIWTLAMRRDGGFPVSFSSAGSGALPAAAALSGLREVAQLVTAPLDWTAEEAGRLYADGWQVRELEDHVRRNSAPDAAERLRRVLGGPRITLREAFPGWPEALSPDHGGILTVLRSMQARFACAGLDEIILVDQSTREHHDRGVAVVKAVVPGTVPMAFGQAHQRLSGLPRLDALLARGEAPASTAPHDPHPFP